MEFIPFNKQEAAELENKLSKSFFLSLEQFIIMYNYDRFGEDKNPEISKLANSLPRVYSNITIKNRKIIVKSKEEVIVNILDYLLPHLELVTTLKRIAYSILEAGYPNGIRLVFIESKQGEVYISEQDSPKYFSYEGAERITGGLNTRLASNPFLNKFIYEFPLESDEIAGAINVIDIIDINTEFVIKAGELIEDYIVE